MIKGPYFSLAHVDQQDFNGFTNCFYLFFIYFVPPRTWSVLCVNIMVRFPNVLKTLNVQF